jgi:hypothetical protein
MFAVHLIPLFSVPLVLGSHNPQVWFESSRRQIDRGELSWNGSAVATVRRRCLALH